MSIRLSDNSGRAILLALELLIRRAITLTPEESAALAENHLFVDPYTGLLPDVSFEDIKNRIIEHLTGQRSEIVISFLDKLEEILSREEARYGLSVEHWNLLRRAILNDGDLSRVINRIETSTPKCANCSRPFNSYSSEAAVVVSGHLYCMKCSLPDYTACSDPNCAGHVEINRRELRKALVKMCAMNHRTVESSTVTGLSVDSPAMPSLNDAAHWTALNEILNTSHPARIDPSDE